jgi:hypothetical protein
MYSNDSTIAVHKEVHHRRVLRPILFNLYIDNLVRDLASLPKQFNSKMFAFTDDLLVVGSSDPFLSAAYKNHKYLEQNQ